MMPGKRSGRPGGHPMRRTTSLTEFTPPDVLAADDAAEQQAEEDEELHLPVHAEEDAEKEDPYGWACGAKAGSGRSSECWLMAYRARAAPALLGLRRNSADFSAAETAAFLRSCGLCNRRLGPGRDTFMYRGDTAFCSLECRQQHITIEEWKEKCTPLATTHQADDPVKPASETPDKTTAATAAAGGGAGGMLAAA